MSSRWKIALWIAGGAALAIVAALVIVSVMISRRARVWVQDSLTHEFNSKVELSSFSIAVPFPLVQGEGENLALHFQGREDLPPLIVVKRFTMRTSIWGLIRASHHISYVQLEGLEINVLTAASGIDIRRPALKLPGLGRLGVAQSSRPGDLPAVGKVPLALPATGGNAPPQAP